MGNLVGLSKKVGEKEVVVNKLIWENEDMVKKARVMQFLIDAFNGEEIAGEKLSLIERIDVAKFIAKKIVPDLKAVEHKTGESFVIQIINYGETKK